MAETRVRALPVLPLTTGVVGPQMVVTLALETPEARAAADDASRGDGRILLVPRLEGGRYAKVGTVAKIEQDGGLPGGQRALVVRGLERAVIGAGRTDLGDALWVESEPVGPGVVSSPEIDRLVTRVPGHDRGDPGAPRRPAAGRGDHLACTTPTRSPTWRSTRPT